MFIWSLFMPFDNWVIFVGILYNSIMENPDPQIPNLGKLLSFLSYHSVEPQQIWGEQLHLSALQFTDTVLERFGYQVSMDELIQLRKLADSSQRLFVHHFHDFGLWKDYVCQEKERKVHNTSMGTFKTEKPKKHQRPQTAKQPVTKNLYSEKSNIFESGCSQKTGLMGTESCVRNRQRQANKVLNKKILQNALDKKWEYLIKVGEMNSWRKELRATHRQLTQQGTQEKVPIKNVDKIYKIEDYDQNIVIIEERQDGENEALPLKVFDQKYSSMKKKIANEEKLKNNMKGTMLLVLDKQEKVSKSKLNQKISQRDQELNYLLLQIMRLKDVFQQQEKVLIQCGVNM